MVVCTPSASNPITANTTCEEYMAHLKEETDKYRRSKGLPVLKIPEVQDGKKVY